MASTNRSCSVQANPLTSALRTATSDVSPSVLNTRLSELRALGVVAVSDDGYVLTDSGRDLGEILLQLDDWARAHG